MGYEVDIMAVWVTSQSQLDTWNDFRTGKGGDGSYLAECNGLSTYEDPHHRFLSDGAEVSDSNRDAEIPRMGSVCSRRFDDITV